MELDEDTAIGIVEEIKRGNYPEVAAMANGVSSSTYYSWLKKGKKNQEMLHDSYGKFYRKVVKAVKFAKEAHGMDIWRGVYD